MQGLSISVEQIAPEKLLAGAQVFGFSVFLKDLGLWDEKWPCICLEKAGILSPVLVQRHESSGFRIIDGFKRAFYADKKKLSYVPAMVLPETMSSRDIFLLVLGAQKDYLKTPAMKATFLRFLDRAGVPRETIIADFMPPLELGANENLLRKYMRIAEIPATVLRFCHQKGFSMKRCLNLSHHKKGLLDAFFARSSRLNLSASLAEELLDNINDILRRDGLSAGDFFARQDVTEILGGDMDTRERTSRFRRLARILKFPVLTDIEGQMEETRKNFTGTGSFHVSWDKSLENRAVHINASVKNTDEFRRLVSDLEKENSAEGIKALLSYL